MAKQLKEQFDAIRTIPSEGCYGRLGRKPCDDIFIGSDTLPCGPFDNECDLNEAFYQRHLSLHLDLGQGRGAFYRDCVFSTVLKGHPPVFTHGDLQAKNILIRSSDGAPCIIDWECSAWYPSYWEYTNSLWTSRRWEDDWYKFLGEFLDKHVVKFKCVDNMLGDLLDAPQPGMWKLLGTKAVVQGSRKMFPVDCSMLAEETLLLFQHERPASTYEKELFWHLSCNQKFAVACLSRQSLIPFLGQKSPAWAVSS